MQALHTTLRTIWSQINTLSATARLLIGAMAVILVMTLVLVAQFSTRASLQPLGLQANLSTEARARAISYIQQRGIPHRERAGEVLVPADQKYAILAQLTDGEIITPDQINFDTLVQQASPFLSKSQNERQWLVATMNVLSHTISRLSGIDRAVVVIDEPKSPTGIGRAHLPASASVTVWTRGGPLSQGTVDAIAEMVAGAHAAMRAEDVRVIDSNAGRVHRARGEDDLLSARTMELQQSAERMLRGKITEALAYIPGVNVAVHATVDTRKIEQQTRSFDEPRLGVTGESSRSLVSSGRGGAGEAGMRPNTGASITGGGGGSSLTDERTEAAMVPAFPTTDSRIFDPRGHAVQINATVGVPRSYFVRLYRDRRDDPAAQPEPDELDALVEAETDRIRGQIEPLIDTRAVDGAQAGMVSVSMIPDFGMAAAAAATAAPAVETASGFSVAAGDGGLLKHITLAGLALLSLAMMFLMVRRVSVKEELPSAAELIGVPPALAEHDGDLVGEAGETSSSLIGLEIDEDDLRHQQMLNQINDLAKNNPKEAASLVRRWVKAEV